MCFCIRIYQKLVSPLLPRTCRFYPTCSSYAYQAIQMHGPYKGFWLALKRILRCNPFHSGGYDPVVSRKVQKNSVMRENLRSL